VVEEDCISGLLAGEGTVGRYGDLLKLGRRGDNLTPHHVPSSAYMMAKVSGYTRNLGIAIMMEHPIPGAGGRHRQTLSYGKSPDLGLQPRQVLAREIQDLRSLYQRQGVYTEEIKRNLRLLVHLNQAAWVGVFEKSEHIV
jgi:filamentous hemagglutinin